ncbi:hypothetical protein J6TS7_29640 [Paenibacillus dendritiformis]|uniref:hypothetical protein n=1 Tax=Paenibacillus TaxID=44249 RepID=UPI001B226C1B|nr:hypothetical protein [Paenibacillus dendritiformis]GIO79354.1 hypothetical protein J6TS7_29640 [Paenibacillus dendritiformis]
MRKKSDGSRLLANLEEVDRRSQPLGHKRLRVIRYLDGGMLLRSKAGHRHRQRADRQRGSYTE